MVYYFNILEMIKLKKYTTLLVDLDDTLVDKNSSIYYAYHELMKMDILDLPYNQKEAEAFAKFDSNYWKEHEKNGWMVPKEYQTSKEEEVYYLRTERFIRYFEEVLKLTSKAHPLARQHAAEMNEVYMKALGEYAEAIPGAKDLLSALPRGVQVIVATNGGQQAAENRLKLAGLEKYVDKVISSEALGYSKPAKEFFECLFKKNPQIIPAETLMLGDDLTTDIMGANNVGIDSCWFNYTGKAYPSKATYTYFVENLEDVVLAFDFSEQYQKGNALAELNDFSRQIQKTKHR